MEIPFSGDLVIGLGEFRGDLSLIDGMEGEEGILDFGLFFHTNNIVINRSGIYKAKEFYPNFFSFKDMTYQQWDTYIKYTYFTYDITPQEQFVLNEKKYNGNLMFHSYSINRKTSEVVLCYYLDNRYFMEAFDALNAESDGRIYALNHDGKLMFGRNPQQDFSGLFTGNSGYFRVNDRIICYVYLPNPEWIIVFDQSCNIIFSEIETVRNFSIIFSILYLFFTVGVSLYFFRRNYRLFEDLLVLIRGKRREADRKPDIYLLLKNGLIELQNENRNLSNHEQEQAVILKNQFFNSLLEGSRTYWEEGLLREFIAHASETRWYAVSLVIIEREVSVFAEAPPIRLLQTIPSVFYTLKKSGFWVVIHNSTMANREAAGRYIAEELNSVRMKLDHQDSAQFYACTGELVQDLRDICVSYSQAQQIINLNRAKRSPGVTCGIPDSGDNHILIQEGQLNILSSAVVSNDRKKIEDCFNTWRNILSDESLLIVDRQFFLTHLYYTLHHTLSGLRGEINIPGLDPSFFTRIHDLSMSREYLKNLQDLCLAVSSELEKQRKSHNWSLIEKIKEYIHWEYIDANLSAQLIADHFEISELYFYHFFKEQTGITFSDYLENVRLEQARELLKGNMKIKDVASATGYNSSTAFGRAFKRKWGITAGECRNTG